MAERGPAWPGEVVGLILLEYVGEAPTPRTWRGLETGWPYRFGGARRVGYVDKADAIKWLSPRGGGRAFRIYRGKEKSLDAFRLQGPGVKVSASL